MVSLESSDCVLGWAVRTASSDRFQASVLLIGQELARESPREHRDCERLPPPIAEAEHLSGQTERLAQELFRYYIEHPSIRVDFNVN